jgi:hypothetical protein
MSELPSLQNLANCRAANRSTTAFCFGKMHILRKKGPDSNRSSSGLFVAVLFLLREKGSLRLQAKWTAKSGRGKKSSHFLPTTPMFFRAKEAI